MILPSLRTITDVNICRRGLRKPEYSNVHIVKGDKIRSLNMVNAVIRHPVNDGISILRASRWLMNKKALTISS